MSLYTHLEVQKFTDTKLFHREFTDTEFTMTEFVDAEFAEDIESIVAKSLYASMQFQPFNVTMFRDRAPARETTHARDQL